MGSLGNTTGMTKADKVVKEHRMVVEAESALLQSISKERINFLKTDTTQPKGPKLNKSAKELAHFGTLDQEVFSLPKDGRDTADGPLERVSSLKRHRKARHDQAFQKYQHERESIGQQMQEAVSTEALAFKQRLMENDSDIEVEFSALADDRLVVLEEHGVQRVWDEVQSQSPIRMAWIDGLAESLAHIETDRQTLMRDSVAELIATLNEVSALSVGEVERLIEAESMSLNLEVVENKRTGAELIRRLQRAEVEAERARRKRWEDSMERWRKLRTLGAMQAFQQLLLSEEFASPPPRAQLMSSLLEQQEVAHSKVLQHIEMIDSLLPPNSILGTDAMTEWLDVARSDADRWDEMRQAGIAHLWEYENELHQKALDHFTGLQADVKRYAGYSEEEATQMLEEEAMIMVRDRQHQAESTLKSLAEFMEKLSATWRSQWGTLGDFLLQLSKLHDEHKARVTSLHQAAVADVKESRAQHDADDKECEDAYNQATILLKQSGGQKELEENLSKTMDCLDAIQEGYRKFHARTTQIVEKNPVTMKENGETYQRDLCELLGLKPNLPDIVVVEEPPPPPEPEPEARPTSKGSQKGKDKKKKKDEPPPPPPEPEPEPEPEEEPLLLSTDLGTTFKVKEDLHDRLFLPPPPTPPPEGEEGASAPAAPAEAATAEEPPEEPPPAEETPAAMFTDLPISEEMLRVLLTAIQVRLLTEMEEHNSKVLLRADQWCTAGTQELTEELEACLRAHRPRAGHVEEDLQRAREVELLEQARRADNFLKGITRSILAQQEAQLRKRTEAEKELEDLVNKITTAERNLNTELSTKHLKIKQRQIEKLKAEIIDMVSTRCDFLRTQLKQDEEEVATSHGKFDSNFKSFEDGGSYTPEAVASIRERLNKLVEEGGLARADALKDVDELQEKTLSSTEANYTSFIAELDPHNEDLSLIEAIDKTISGAKSQMKLIFSDSTETANKIHLELKQLQKLVRKSCKDKCCLQLLKSMHSLRMLLHPRCLYLGCLRAEMEVEAVELDYETSPEAKAEAMAASTAQTPDEAPTSREESPSPPDATEDAPVKTSLLDAVQELVTQARQMVVSTAEAYYAAKDPKREITRPDSIPPTLQEIEAMHEKTFVSMLEQADSHVQAAVKEVRAQVIVVADWFARAPTVAFSDVLKTHKENVELQCAMVDKKYAKSHAVFMAKQEESKLGLKPSMGLASHEAELNALCATEMERAHASVDGMHEHARTVMALLGELAEKFGGELRQAVVTMLTVMDTTVLPEDLHPLEPDDALKALERKNLRQLRRILRAGHGPAMQAKPAPVEAKGRTYKLRAWQDLNMVQLSLDEAGWNEEAMVASSPHRQDEEQADSGGEAAPPTTESAQASPRPIGQVKALDTPCQQACVNSRDRVFYAFRDFYYKCVADHKQLILARLKDETQWKAIWEDLLTNVKSGGLTV